MTKKHILDLSQGAQRRRLLQDEIRLKIESQTLNRLRRSGMPGLDKPALLQLALRHALLAVYFRRLRLGLGRSRTVDVNRLVDKVATMRRDYGDKALRGFQFGGIVI